PPSVAAGDTSFSHRPFRPLCSPSFPYDRPNLVLVFSPLSLGQAVDDLPFALPKTEPPSPLFELAASPPCPSLPSLVASSKTAVAREEFLQGPRRDFVSPSPPFTGPRNPSDELHLPGFILEHVWYHQPGGLHLGSPCCGRNTAVAAVSVARGRRALALLQCQSSFLFPGTDAGLEDLEIVAEETGADLNVLECANHQPQGKP
ncbi:hypothetical protein EJB05_44093, partial [Eragrostis curvula]